MKTATLLVLLLSNYGYWLGGQDAEIAFAPAAEVPLEGDFEFQWVLGFGNATVAQGQSKIVFDEETRSLSPVSIAVPEVRVATQMQLSYRLTSIDDEGAKKELAAGEQTVTVFPKNILQDLKSLLEKKELFVWDEKTGLPETFDAIDVQYQQIAIEAELAFQLPDILLVAGEQLDEDLNNQARLVALAELGTNVCIFKQTQPESLAGFQLVRRQNAPTKNDSKSTVEWRHQHPLASHREMLSTFASESAVSALRIPADHPVTEVVYFRRESPTQSSTSVAIDTLLAVQSIGKGRIVFCQLPLGDWKVDPRSQLFLRDVVGFLVSPIEPTPRPSERDNKTHTDPSANKQRSTNILDSFKGNNP